MNERGKSERQTDEERGGGIERQTERERERERETDIQNDMK